MDKLLESQRRLMQQIQKWLEPQRVLQQQMDKLLEPQRRLQQQIEELLEPRRLLQQEMDKWLEPQHRLQEQIDKLLLQQQIDILLKPQLRLQQQIEKWLEPQRVLMQQIQKWLEPQRHLQEQMIRFLDSATELGLKIDSIITPQINIEQIIEKLLGNIAVDDITVDKTGTFTVAGDSVSASEINRSLQDLLFALEKIPSPVRLLEFLVNILQKSRKPIATIILIIILPFIINISADLSVSYFKDLLTEISHKTRQEQIKDIRKEAIENFDLAVLAEYRFVTASTLNVRENGSVKSRVFDQLHFGHVVKVLKKVRKWSCVQYIDEETGAEVTGWVSNRYLTLFKK